MKSVRLSRTDALLVEHLTNNLIPITVIGIYSDFLLLLESIL